jgi:spermidine synthase
VPLQPSAILRRSAVFPLAAACFFLSGAAALLYEVVWMRLLGLVFGHTVHAVTTVLAAYMGGLALGSLAAGRWADRLRRPLRAYGLIEAAIGLYCLATPLMFRATESVYAWVFRGLQPGPLASGLLHFAMAALVLLPPTALMGATLPILARAVVEGPRLAASRVGTLYAVNTWGAVVGTAATGFALLPALGLRRTVWLGVAIDLVVAALALLLERHATATGEAPREPAEALAAPRGPAVPATAPGRLEVGVALAAIGVAGAASMAYEVAWTRALSLALGSSTYAFTAMLTTFLVGLALGALLVSRLLVRRSPGLAAFGVVEIAVAFLGVAILPLFGRLPEAMLLVLGSAGVSHASALAAQFGLGFLVMIVPTLLIGTTFPLVIAAVGRGIERLGREVGIVYGANTIGTIAGSVLAGFALIPALGIQRTVVVAAAANLAAGLAVLWVAMRGGSGTSGTSGSAVGWLRRRPWLAGGAAVGAFALLVAAAPRWDPRVMTAGVAIYAEVFRDLSPGEFRRRQERRELLLYEEGLSTTVAVSRSPTAISLSVNGKTDASTGRDMATQLMLGHLGALLHPEPRQALVIGLASGITVGAIAQHPLQAIDVAEIEPAMVDASRFFAKENRNALADPRVRVILGDGRQILEAAAVPYDIIVSEPSNPWIAGVASLFTREFYESARRHLAPGGIMVQWLQGYSIFTDDVRMVLRTMQEVFPDVSVWSPFPGDFLLIASSNPPVVDAGAVESRAARSPALREDLAHLRLDAEGLARRFFLGDADARRFAAGAPLNTDDRPLLEFSAPLALYASSASYLANETAMRVHRTEEFPRVVGIDPLRLSGPAGRIRAAWERWQVGTFEQAEEQLARAGPAEGLDAETRLSRARLLFGLGLLDEAAAEFAVIAEMRPDDPTPRAHLRVLGMLASPAVAERLERARRPRAGRPYLDTGAFGELILNLGLQTGDPEFPALALEQLGPAVELFPGKTSLLNNYAIALAKLGRGAEAAMVLRRALDVDPADARTHYNLGMLLERTGAPAEAIPQYREASRLDPAMPGPRERLRLLGAGP